jgi:hypothetical protein
MKILFFKYTLPSLNCITTTSLKVKKDNISYALCTTHCRQNAQNGIALNWLDNKVGSIKTLLSMTLSS